MNRVLVVSHACAVRENQLVYAQLARRGWEVLLVAPATWTHEYGPVQTAPADGLETSLRLIPVAFAGKPQRHVYRTRARRVVESFRPDVVFIDEEPFSAPALQWGLAALRAGIPFGLATVENLDLALPLPARLIRRFILPRAAFVVARSPAAASLARRWGARETVRVVPYGLPAWPESQRTTNGTFTIGFAGRLVEQKGIRDLLAAAATLDAPVRLLFAGNGPLLREVEAWSHPGVSVDVRTGLGHGEMAAAYGEMDVLVLPSRTTPRWVEQFGRVLVEALWCGVPVVGSDSGEIPWVIDQTEGGIVFHEGDADDLARAVTELRVAPERRAALASQGRANVERLFSLDAAASGLDALLHEVAA